jgi:hypothetical protein
MDIVLHYTPVLDERLTYVGLCVCDHEGNILHSNAGKWSRSYMLEYFVGMIRQYKPKHVLVRIGEHEPQALSARTVNSIIEGRRGEDFLIQ